MGSLNSPSSLGLIPSFSPCSQGRQEMAGDTAPYEQSGPGNSVVCHGFSTRMCWRRSCTRRFHIHSTQLLPSAKMGWERTFVDWNMGKAGWKTRRLAEVVERESLLCRQL